MKYIYVWMMAAALILSACGSNDKPDKGEGIDAGEKFFKAEPAPITFNKLNFNISPHFTKEAEKDVTVLLKNFTLALEGCSIESVKFTPETLLLDGDKGSQKSLKIEGNVTRSCAPTAYVIRGDRVVTEGGRSKTVSDELLLSTRVNSSGNPVDAIDPSNPTVEGLYGFYNIPSSVDIRKAAETYPIKIQLIDKNIKGVSGKEVEILAYDVRYGEIEEMKVTTDGNGFANFLYTSPKDLAPIDGDLLALTVVYDDNGTRVDSANITLSFTASGAASGKYNFMNATSITVTAASQEHLVTVDLVDNTGTGIAGEEVRATVLPIAFGSLSPATVKTDEGGRATFNYMAPSDLSSIDGKSQNINLIHTDEDDNTIAAVVTISIESSSGGGTAYSLVNETTPVTINHPEQVEAILINVVDSLNVGVAGKTVTLSTPSFGALTASSAVTDSAGLAEFSYKAPATLSGLTSTTMTLSFSESGTTVTKEIVVEVNASAVTSTYDLINANSVTVHYALEEREIAVQLVKSGRPIAGESVVAKSIPSAFGRIESASTVTGDDGYARFNYIAAGILADGVQPLELVYTDESGAEATVTVNITVAAKPLYAFTNVSKITIEHGSEKQDIKAQLTYRGVPVEDKVVQMMAFSSANGSILNGYSIVTDSVGYATFFYQAPLTLDDVNGTILSLAMQFDEDATHLEENATVTFKKVDRPSVDENRPTVFIPTGTEFNPLILDSSSKNVEIKIKVFKDSAPYTKGSVKVRLPDEAVAYGVDVGIFEEYNVSVDSIGIATFNYTGPSNLLGTIMHPEVDDNNSLFEFYHTESDSNSSAKLTVEYREPIDPRINRNYSVEVLSGGEFSMGIPDQTKTFNVALKAKDASGNDVTIDKEKITEITVSSQNTQIAQLIDGDSKVESLVLSGDSFTLQSRSLSGLVPVDVLMEFSDVNGEEQNISTIVNVRVFSGPASAISISYVGTEQDPDRAKYTETLAISVTDEYGNKVNTRPNISVGAIAGYAVDGREASGNETNETKRLFYGRDDIDSGIANGEISNLGDDDATTTTFEDSTPARIDVFRYVNAEGNNTDKLVVMGENKNYEAMGKWDVSAGGDNHTLTLQDDYFGENRPGHYYAVGHNYYQDQCRDDGREWVGATDSETYQLDEEGTVRVSYKYDYHLAGKDVLVWVNLDGIQPDTGKKTRVGEAVKHTLRSTDLVAVPESGYLLAKDSRAFATFTIWHKNAPERYRNAHFSYTVSSDSTCYAEVVATSNNFDARTCDNRMDVDEDHNTSTAGTIKIGKLDGTSYVTFYLESKPDEPCKFDIEREMVSREF